MSLISITKFETWIYGLGSGAIGGACGALTAALSTAGLHGAGVNIPNLTFKQIGIIAASGGLWSAVAYLKQSPLPPMSTGDTIIIKKADDQSK